MTTSAPPTMPTFARWRRARFWPLLWLIPIGILAGIVSGALMNAINGWVSPNYFSMFSYTNNPYSLEGWYRIVRHGMREGAVFGVIFSVIYTFVVLVGSRGNCPFRLALRGMLRSIFLLGLTSVLFGLNALLLTWIAPSLIQSRLGILPNNIADLKFLYVDASIWEIYFGGIITVIVGCIWFSFDWRDYKRKIEHEAAKSSIR